MEAPKFESAKKPGPEVKKEDGSVLHLENRSEYREFVSRFLPTDLRLKFDEKGGWNFEGELLRRRHSEIAEDKLFFTLLKELKEGKKTADFDDFNEAAGLLVKERIKSIWEVIDLQPMYNTKSALELGRSLFINPETNNLFAEEIGASLAAVDPEYAREIRGVLNSRGNRANLISAALGDSNVLRENLKTAAKNEKFYEAGKIALYLGDVKLAREYAEKLFDDESKCGESGYEMARMGLEDLAPLVAEKDPEFGKKAEAYFAAKNKKYEAGRIAAAMGDVETAKNIREELYKKGELPLAMDLTLKIAEKDSEFGWRMVNELSDMDLILPPIGAAKVAAVLLKKGTLTPEREKLADVLVKRLIKAGGPDSLGVAGEIAAIIGNRKLLSEIHILLMDSDFGDSVYELYKLKAVMAENLRVSPATKRLLQSISGLTSEKGYVLEAFVGVTVKREENLSAITSKYLPAFLALKSYGVKVNAKMEDTKKWDHPDEFFVCHDRAIFYLQQLDNELGPQLLRSLLSRGFSFADANLNLYLPIVTNMDISRALANFIKNQEEKMTYYDLGSLLEMASGYVESGHEKGLISLLEVPITFTAMKEVLNLNLLTLLSREVGIKEDPKNVFKEFFEKGWPTKYLKNLINHYQFLKRESPATQKLYKEILKSTLTGRFSEYISDAGQKDLLGRKIALHNQKVEAAFKKAGVNWDAWEKFGGQEIADILSEKKMNPEIVFADFKKRLDQLRQVLEDTPLAGSIRKDIAALEKQKKNLDFYSIDTESPNWRDKLFPNYASGLEYLRNKSQPFFPPELARQYFSYVKEFIDGIKGAALERHGKKRFIVKKWDRNPRRDLFQGNYSGCCLALGVKETSPAHLPGVEFNDYPPGILDYLVDKGVQVVEIIDEEVADPIGQCWLFVSLDQNNEPVLVADTIDINERYGLGTNVNWGIREAVFSFLKKYADAIGVKKIVLGKKWAPGGEIRDIVNDVEIIDLETALLPPIKKLGGYFNKKQYFLETTDTTEAYSVR